MNLTINNLSKTYSNGIKALQNISLQIIILIIVK
jgi:ABC-type phosphate/phosphonate transport system ATPase subunit